MTDKNSMLINDCYAVVYFSNGGHLLAHFSLLSGTPVTCSTMSKLIIERVRFQVCKVEIVTEAGQLGNLTIPNIII